MSNEINKPYILLPFNFLRMRSNSLLLVNIVGEYLFLTQDEFNNLVTFNINCESELYLRLKAKHFITESLSDPAIELLSIKYRTKNDSLSQFTSLHMFVTTLRCNQKCSYCHASSKGISGKQYDMSIETAQRAVDICLMSPAKLIKIEFQGGEPLLNFETIKHIIEYANKRALINNKLLEFVVCTNLTLVTDEMLKYFSDNNVMISTSIDGPEHVHNFNRQYQDGGNTYEDVIRSLDKTRRYISNEKISALMTTTKYSLAYPHEIIDEYIKIGINSIFIRQLNPFGYAHPKQNIIGYSASEFVEFYKKILEYIININLKGFFIEEAFSSILLTRILTPFSTGFVDLKFPAGTGISGVVYDYDGNVYPSDEARMLAQMGNNTFCLGNVCRDTYKELFYNRSIKNIIEKTCAESLPGCSDCAFQVYCGIDPIRNYLKYGDIVGHRPTCDLCFINKEIIEHLFGIILTNNPNIMDIFWSWLTGRTVSEINQ